MRNTVWMLVLLLGVSSCSRNKAAQDVAQETPQIELSDTTDEFSEAPVEEAPALTEVTPGTEPAALSDVSMAPEVGALESAPLALSDTPAEYVVQKNETLMMIAFKLYGDYGKWRDLANRNQNALVKGQTRQGMKLSYLPPAEPFSWNPQGNPHLIRTGDTLGKISGEVYGSSRKWKHLWDNNRPLIKDPNRIFAGFTLYWMELGKVASAEL